MLRYVVTPALLLSTACLQVDADIPKACFLQSGVRIEALEIQGVEVRALLEEAERLGLPPPESLLPEGGVQQSFVRDGLDAVPQTFDDFGATGAIKLLLVDVFATSGLESFGRIERVAVRVATVSGALEPFVLAECDRSLGCDTSGAQVSLQGDAARDLMPYLREGELEFTLELDGLPPVDAWEFDVDVCMSGQASLSASL